MSVTSSTQIATPAPTLDVACCGDVAAKKSRRVRDVFDRTTDGIIRFTGSPPVLAGAGLFEIGWLAAGKPAKFSNGWQLVMSDVSTIAVFCMNPVLQNAENRHAREQQVRFDKGVEMAQQLARAVDEDLGGRGGPVNVAAVRALPRSGFDVATAWVSRKVGSPAFFIGCLGGLAVWAGVGARMHWSNSWQLILNSATSAFELPAVLTLHNTKLHDDAELGRLLDAEIGAMQADAEAMGYELAAVNPAQAQAQTRGWLSRGIHFIARLEGSPAAIAVQVGLVAAWPGLGPTMHWNDDWQLVLGTTTSIASYIFLLVLMHTHDRHIRAMRAAGAQMVRYTAEALERWEPERAAAATALVDSAVRRPNWAARFTSWCHAGAASTTGVVVGLSGIGVWAATKAALNFTTWMLVINSATMVGQTLAFVLILHAHHVASAQARRDLWQHGLMRELLFSGRHRVA